jgi:hypothetical protein
VKLGSQPGAGRDDGSAQASNADALGVGSLRFCPATRSRCCSRQSPRYLLFEASLLLASIAERRTARRVSEPT